MTYAFTWATITIINIVNISTPPKSLFLLLRNPSLPFSTPPLPFLNPQTTIDVFSITVDQSLHFLKTFVNGIIQYVLFFVCLISLSIIIWGFTHIVCVYQYFTSLCCWMVFHCMDIAQCVYSIPCHWTVGFFPAVCYYTYSCYEHSCTSFCVDLHFLFSQVNNQEYNEQIIW